MSYKITYILGAGASAGAKNDVLPTINNLSQELYAQAAFLKSKGIPNEDLDKFDWLVEQSKEFSTIDTLAKYYHIKGKKEHLKELKNILSFYFTIEQFINYKFDNRYLNFLTTIMDENKFPENIKILSWNYDFQLEIAAERFKNEIVNDGNAKSPPLINYFPNTGIISNNDSNYSLVHLNGIAGTWLNKDGLNNCYILNKDVDIGELHKIYKSTSTALNFAWEVENPDDFIMLNIARNIIAETEILVVIGYSFPFFNRLIDKKIFEVFKNNGTLKKIYFQNPYLDGQTLINQFDLKEIHFDPNNIIHITDKSQFYVPFEY